MPKEIRLFGPPGTGKTTTLTNWVIEVAEQRGPEGIMVASYTRTAAAEIASRPNLPLQREQVGTLHSHCYRGMFHAPIAETHIEQFNAYAPMWTLSKGNKRNMDEPASDQQFDSENDAILAHYHVLRHRLIPRGYWPTNVQAFARRWEAWKATDGLIDFTDMIENAPILPPGGATVGFFDEAQDFTRLELQVIRRWAEHMDYVVIAGDDDQTIYDFAGATPDAFLQPPVPDEQKRVLSQSYRVPVAVHAIAQRWIMQLGHREPKHYQPRDFEGAVESFDATYLMAERVIDDVQVQLAAGKRVMLLTSCSYMLDHLQMFLRLRALPYHNPYRRTRGDWNPLGGHKGISTVERILTFLRPDNAVWGDGARMWTYGDLQLWADLVKVEGTFTRGTKKLLETMPGEREVDLIWLANHMEPAAMDAAFDGNLQWLSSNILSSKARAAEYPILVAERRGASTLRRVPQLIIGTIHSVKGGEADVVYVFPDISRNAMEHWIRGGDGHDSIVRQFYVGMTRAREILKICQPASGYYVSLPV